MAEFERLTEEDVEEMRVELAETRAEMLVVFGEVPAEGREEARQDMLRFVDLMVEEFGKMRSALEAA